MTYKAPQNLSAILTAAHVPSVSGPEVHRIPYRQPSLAITDDNKFCKY